jgi:type I restriction enzyme R subunit
MITGEIRNQIDRIWDAFWAGGISNPLEVIEQITYVLFLVDNDIGGPGEIEKARQESSGLGVFVRSLVGLDRYAAKDALGSFLDGKRLTASQIEFVDMIVNHLTEHGLMDASLLYGSPFTDLTPHGPNGLFLTGEVTELISALESFRATAVAA